MDPWRFLSKICQQSFKNFFNTLMTMKANLIVDSFS